MPPGFQRQRLTARRTETFLLQPQIAHRPPAPQGLRLLARQPLLEVRFPGRVIGVRVPAYLHVSANPDRSRTRQLNQMRFAVAVVDDPGQHPMAVAHRAEVLGLHPAGPLLVVPPTRPLPDRTEGRAVHIVIGTFTGRVAVIQRPTPNDRVEALNQLPRGQRTAFFPDQATDFGQPRPDGPSRRLQVDPAVAVAPDVLAQEVEPVFDAGDAGFLVGECETPLRQEVLHERLDPIPEEGLRRARDEEIIRIPDQVDLVPSALRRPGAEALP